MAKADVFTLDVPMAPERLQPLLLTQLTASLAAFKFTLIAQDQVSLTYKRRYTPDWAMVLAVLGFLVFLLGLLFLLVKREDIVVVSLMPGAEKGTTKVVITGGYTQTVPRKIEAIVTQAARGLPADGQTGGVPPGWYPNPEGDGQRYWDGSRWTQHVAPPQMS